MQLQSPHNPAARRAFTIIELLVVIGVIGVLAALTTIGARRLTSSSRLAAGTNAVSNALGTARAAAIRDSAPTGLVFRPVWDSTRPNQPQRVECTFIRSTGERTVFGASASGPDMAERWLPLDNVPPVQLPEGIKVAGPMYDPPGSFGSTPSEQIYATQAELPLILNCAETIECNRVVAVLFGADGQFLTRPPLASLGDMKCFVDWNRNGATVAAGVDPQDVAQSNCASDTFEGFWLQDHPDDECNLMFVPFLSVYDDKAARELKGTDWSNTANFVNDLAGPQGYIAQFGDRINFNRFSGIPERKVR